MSPSLVSTVAAGAALFAGFALGTSSQSYQIVDTYKGNTFFDGFNFWESKVTSDPNTIDPTGGFVHYRNRTDATSMGLVKHNKDGSVRVGVDASTPMSSSGPLGRSSVRIESTTAYDEGLFIFDLAHFPKPVSGAWPAIWTYGTNWPYNGDIDIYENWNDNFAFNRQTLHTGNLTTCTVKGTDMSATFETNNCDSFYTSSTQSQDQGCSADDYGTGAWGDKNGGVYAVEMNSAHIKMWHFTTVPSDIAAGKPDPTGWGQPTFNTAGGSGSCDISSNYGPQTIVFNIDFCGVAGDWWAWSQTSAYTVGGETSCWDYVAQNPTKFAEVYFDINSVKVYKMGNTPSASASTSTIKSTSSSATLSSTSSTRSSTASSSASTTTSVASSSSASSTASASTSRVSSTSSSTGSSTRTSSASTITGSSSLTTSSHYPASTSSDDDYCEDDQTTTRSGRRTSTMSSHSTKGRGPRPSTTGSSASTTTSKSGSVSTSPGSSKSTGAHSGYGTSPIYIDSTTTSSSATKSSISHGSSRPTGAHSGYGTAPIYTDSTTATTTSYTTSTIYKTSVYTITSCKPEVTNCPTKIGKVTTEVIATTTVCPVTETDVPAKPTTFSAASLSYVTSTQYVTAVYTVTACASSASSCHVGSVTTEVKTSVTVSLASTTAPAIATYTGSDSSAKASVTETYAYGNGTAVVTLTRTATAAPLESFVSVPLVSSGAVATATKSSAIASAITSSTAAATTSAVTVSAGVSMKAGSIGALVVAAAWAGFML